MNPIERVYREEYGRVVASLVRRFGDIDIAFQSSPPSSSSGRPALTAP